MYQIQHVTIKKWARKSDDDTTNADAESKYSRMTCGSKKLAKKRDFG